MILPYVQTPRLGPFSWWPIVTCKSDYRDKNIDSGIPRYINLSKLMLLRKVTLPEHAWKLFEPLGFRFETVMLDLERLYTVIGDTHLIEMFWPAALANETFDLCNSCEEFLMFPRAIAVRQHLKIRRQTFSNAQDHLVDHLTSVPKNFSRSTYDVSSPSCFFTSHRACSMAVFRLVSTGF